MLLAHVPYHIKTEGFPSPVFPSTPAADLQHFEFNFDPANPRNDCTLYRFGGWPTPVSPLSRRGSSACSDPSFSNMSYSDDYDDIGDLPMDQSGISSSYIGSSNSASMERTVRRRSSKACDQCRKSKCKCERANPNEACKNCLMLGTACTFLGPSRKRGPPKGYIDAIEARLHQTEALLGIMLSTADPRAQSLLRDIGKDPLAREIITRVDNSPYGVRGRKRDDVALTVGKLKSAQSSETSLTQPTKPELPDPSNLDLKSTHPSNEWQDRVSAMLNNFASQSGNLANDPKEANQLYSPKSVSSDDGVSPGGRRQRRRVDNLPGYSNSAPGSAISLHDTSLNQQYPSPLSATKSTFPFSQLSPARARFRGDDGSPSTSRARGARSDGEQGNNARRRSSSLDVDDSMTSDSEDEFMGAVGQLSLNEDEQVRYHGKASGLHLLGHKERLDRRNEGGIWRFPKARVWPPLPSGSKPINGDDEFFAQLPSPAVQEHLLDLYFTYVHPAFPVLHKKSFMEVYRSGNQAESSPSPSANASSEAAKQTSPFNNRPRRTPTLLLFAIFALASRYDPNTTPLPSDPSMMWSAGDEYLDFAKVILDSTYASSKPSTCQALLLMGYREIGIGAMAQAWTYIGMGIRMAQDLGMHRSADGWERVGLGGRLFSEWELMERKRIWFGCVIMDKYVSAYIGRPLMIFERDFDTTLPSEDDLEELEEWSVETPTGERSAPMPGRVISCFNASASLSGILSKIVQAIYAVRPSSSRHAESMVLEGLLDRWYLDLPEHLRYDPNASAASKQQAPLPNVLTLHMQYWCAVLLLHRPFIRHVLQGKIRQPDDLEEAELWASSKKSYELCNAAANHITSIVTLYQEKYLIARCSVVLCYYVFTASIMHDTNLTVHPNDPQARLGLAKCLNALRAMRVVWPSAARAIELFGGATVGPPQVDDPALISLMHSSTVDRRKRVADQDLDDTYSGSHPPRAWALGLGGQDDRTPGQNHDSRFDFPSVGQGGQNTPSQQQNYGSTNSLFSANGGYPTAPPTTSSIAGTSLANNPAYWQGGDIDASFNGPLSTAVLPQLFSSGLVDDSRLSSHAQTSRSEFGSQMDSQAKGRYPHAPQYFDYSNFPPSAYGMQVPQPQQQQQSSQMYIPDQFGIYNNQPYNGR